MRSFYTVKLRRFLDRAVLSMGCACSVSVHAHSVLANDASSDAPAVRVRAYWIQIPPILTVPPGISPRDQGGGGLVGRLLLRR